MSILIGFPVSLILTIILWLTVLSKSQGAELGIFAIVSALSGLTLYLIPAFLILIFFVGYRVDKASNHKAAFNLRETSIEFSGLVIGFLIIVPTLFFLANVSVGKYAELTFSKEQIRENSKIILLVFPFYIFLFSYFGVKAIQLIKRMMFKKLLILSLFIVVSSLPLIISIFLFTSFKKEDVKATEGFELSNFKIENINVTKTSFGAERTEFNMSADLKSASNMKVAILPSIDIPYSDSASTGVGGSTKDSLINVSAGNQKINIHFGTGAVCMPQDFQLIESNLEPEMKLKIVAYIEPQQTKIEKTYPFTLLTIKQIFQHCKQKV